MHFAFLNSQFLPGHSCVLQTDVSTLPVPLTPPVHPFTSFPVWLFLHLRYRTVIPPPQVLEHGSHVVHFAHSPANYKS